MATSSKTCGVCELRHITKQPIVWCTECDEGLCTDCQVHHSLSKSSRSHSVIPFTDYQKLPADILKITQYCTKHDKKYQIYCQKHELPCCSKCVVESHKECQDFIEIEAVIHNVKTSNAVCEIEETLVEVSENLQKIRKHQRDNLTTLKESRKEIEKEIKMTRIKINNHLDKLQEDLMNQLYAIEEQENSKISQLLSLLEKKEKEIEDWQKNIMNIKLHATDLQMFLSMKHIEKDLYRTDKFLQTLVKGEGQHFVSYTINNSIHSIMSDIKSFGEVSIESELFDIVLSEKKTKQAQMLVPLVETRSIEDIKLSIRRNINTQGGSVYGCCILPDGRLAFTYCWDGTVKVFSDTGLKDFEVKMSGYAFDIVYISKDNTLAVTSGGSAKQCITIIDLERKQTKKTISLDSGNYGVSLKDNLLIYSGGNKGIQMINLYDESVSDITSIPMPLECYTASYGDKIFYTIHNTNTITCCNLQGEIQWTFQNDSVIKFPRGIDVDNDGNVYVAGIISQNVVVISPDGKRHKEVLTAGDGIGMPNSLHYSDQRNQLLIANYDNNAFLFDLI